jgi:isocitrate lyase
VGAGYFDSVSEAITAGTSSIGALKGSTEEQQFAEAPGRKAAAGSA